MQCYKTDYEKCVWDVWRRLGAGSEKLSTPCGFMNIDALEKEADIARTHLGFLFEFLEGWVNESKDVS